VHNVSQWPNLRHVGESRRGAEGLLEAVSSKMASSKPAVCNVVDNIVMDNNFLAETPIPASICDWGHSSGASQFRCLGDKSSCGVYNEWHLCLSEITDK